MNAAILAIQMLALSDEKLAEAFAAYKEGLKKKIVKANEELKEVKFEYKTNLWIYSIIFEEKPQK